MFVKNAEKKEDLTLLTPLDLFDRVINVRLNMVNPSAENKTNMILDSIVIRSDYEIVFENFEITRLLRTLDMPNYAYRIQKCTHKPSIKVQYKRLTGNVAVQIDVFIDNFYALAKNGKFLAQFNSNNYKVGTIDIMLGYAGQFALLPPVNAADFMSFRPVAGVQLLKGCQVLYVTQDKLPPDGTLHITAVVGNVSASPIDYKAKLPLKYTMLAPTGLKRIYSLKGGISTKQILFDNITRRFSRIAALPKTKYALNLPDPMSGLLNPASAELIGVKCILSPEAAKIEFPTLKDSKGVPVPNQAITLDTQNDLLSCFNQINTTLFSGELNASMLNDGNLLIFTKEEISDYNKRELLCKMLAPQFAVDSTFIFYKNRLPAVYNIVTGAVAYITCPFFFLASPFQELRFKNRYATGSALAYLANFTAQESIFYALSMQVSFATVDDVNEMKIDCVVRKE